MRSLPRLLSILCLTVTGCTSVQPIDWYGTEDAPLAMTVTALPPPGPSGVLRDAHFLLTFDDYPDPDTLPFGSVTLTSGAALFDATVRLRFVDRAIELVPRSLLSPNNLYLVAATGVRSLGGRELPHGAQGTRIGVGDQRGTPPVAPPPPTWSQVKTALQSCATQGCHSSQGGLEPARALALDGDPRDTTYGLLGVPARSRRDTGPALARVSAGDAARSVLLRKLIGGDPSEARGGEIYPKLAIDGERMPPWPAPPVDDATLRLVEDWIDSGAIVD